MIWMLNIYRKFRGLDCLNQIPKVLAGFQFLIKEGPEFFGGKNSNHIIDETADSYTPASVLASGIWRQAKDFVDLI
jgi:hypothetical protein